MSQSSVPRTMAGSSTFAPVDATYLSTLAKKPLSILPCTTASNPGLMASPPAMRQGPS